ncbi:hypothetical protein P2C08_11870 [Xanthomonas perforans]|uniref:hypothetical protein n=1 Tax=Xanthomonas TaxID=338 RepID=UPI000F7661C4|nr:MULTISPECIES: hypothetical protein [Xanthomonas]MBV6870902.1 hypothetical protein [Xanthomonas campestris pv. veroniae]MBV6897279.1 hypothetical protein [Xanthomonas campestris pv. ionidii]
MSEVIIVELPIPQADGKPKSYAAFTATHPPTRVGNLFTSAEEVHKNLKPGEILTNGTPLKNSWATPGKNLGAGIGQLSSYKESKLIMKDSKTGAFAAEVVCWELGPGGYTAATVQPEFRYWTGILNSGLGWFQVFDSPDEATGACQEMIKKLEKPDLKGFSKRTF